MTVHCRHDKLGIVTDARVVELEYDAIKERVENVELGNYQYDYFGELSRMAARVGGAIRSDGTVAAEVVYGEMSDIRGRTITLGGGNTPGRMEIRNARKRVVGGMTDAADAEDDLKIWTFDNMHLTIGKNMIINRQKTLSGKAIF